jgi:hypothetical protein
VRTLEDALDWLRPLRDALGPAVGALGRVAVDGVRAERPWRTEPEWDLTALTDLFATYGITDVEATAEHAQRLAREGRIPATALAAAQRPGRGNQLVLRL